MGYVWSIHQQVLTVFLSIHKKIKLKEEKMKKMLVKFSSNWADEMDVEGLFLITQEDWEAFKKNG